MHPAVMTKDDTAFNRALESYLREYKKADFPKPNIVKKISVEGTLLVNWGQHQNLEAKVPNGFGDYIVRLT